MNKFLLFIIFHLVFLNNSILSASPLVASQNNSQEFYHFLISICPNEDEDPRLFLENLTKKESSIQWNNLNKELLHYYNSPDYSGTFSLLHFSPDYKDIVYINNGKPLLFLYISDPKRPEMIYLNIDYFNSYIASQKSSDSFESHSFDTLSQYFNSYFLDYKLLHSSNESVLNQTQTFYLKLPGKHPLWLTTHTALTNRALITDITITFQPLENFTKQ